MIYSIGRRMKFPAKKLILHGFSSNSALFYNNFDACLQQSQIIFQTLKLYKTKGIVLKTVKYAETSLIVSIYTELFGLQSYLVNGVRTSSKKGPGRANLFQPSALLEMIVYHQDMKNLQRIREFKWGHLYQNLFSDVIRHSVGLFMIEILQKCIRQPEPHPDLFHFIEDSFIHLDKSRGQVLANFPLFFMLNLTDFFGFRIMDEYSSAKPYFDYKEAAFNSSPPDHPYFLDPYFSQLTSTLLQVRQPHELEQISLNRDSRKILLQAYQDFYAHQLPEFGILRSLPILQTLLSPG
jgi:DNA repair protein RecO (recombination protein O)